MTQQNQKKKPRKKKGKRKGKKGLDPSLIVFQLTLLILVFLGGAYLEHRGVGAFKSISRGFDHLLAFVDERLREHPMLLKPIVHKGKRGVTINDKARSYEGWTVMQGWFEDGLQLRLIDQEGKIINQWMIDFHAIWPKPDHVQPQENVPKTPLNYHAQGLHVFEDGSILTNVGNLGAVKLDRCGEVLWTVDRMTHHSINRDRDGTFWMPANSDYREIPKQLLFFGVTHGKLAESSGRYENLLLHVDAQGEVLKAHSVLSSLAKAGLEHRLFDGLRMRSDDPTHVNDIEIVTPPLAAKIEGVFAGDLLVSIRQLHMLAIFDREDGRLKWHKTGPWVRQHDPDITPDGNITVFNNRRLGVFVRGGWGSNILEFDPARDRTWRRFPRTGDRDETRMYTDIEGAHEVLPNSNILIVESRAGRVFEVNALGQVVWEYVAAYDDEHAALIEEARRFKPEYFTVKDWACPAP